ncbi:MAG: RIP metalloprotease RseP [Opitutae bacterium]|nr:RIP metalloprotease RseP [Opitutae bacterium]
MPQLLLAIILITFSIFVHELGHFFVARWRGLVVPRFSIFGIGKPIVRWRWRGVEYCICMLPIGAYVMIPQLSDMGEFEGDVPEEARKLPPAGYLSKVLVAAAGPAANLLFALALACVVWAVGVDIPAEFNRTEIGDVAAEITTTDGRVVPGPAKAAGLQAGDVIRKIDGQPVASFQDIVNAVIFGSQVAPDGRRVAEITFERDGRTLTTQVFPQLVGTEGIRAIGLGPRSTLLVDSVSPDSAAAAAGIQPGDRFLAVDGKLLTRRDELREHFQKKNTEPSVLTIKRGDTERTVSILPRKQTVEGQTLYLIGVTWKIDTVHIRPTPFAQFREAVGQAYQTLSSLFNRRSDIGVRHMSGIVGIVDNLQQVAAAGLVPTFAFLIIINISLAIFNLLPIPVLDGGHIFLATIAKLRGRPIDPVWLQHAATACFFMLIGLIVYVTYNDIRRAIQSRWEERPAQTAPAKPAPEPGK